MRLLVILYAHFGCSMLPYAFLLRPFQFHEVHEGFFSRFWSVIKILIKMSKSKNFNSSSPVPSQENTRNYGRSVGKHSIKKSGPGQLGAMYNKLPKEFSNFGATSGEGLPENGPKNIMQYIEAISARTGKAPGALNVYFPLSKQKMKMKPKSSASKKRFSSADKRQVGLHLLPKKGLKFEDFIQLHAMWKEYMVDLLNLKELIASGYQSLPLEGRGAEISLQLLRADYHGAFVTVTRSLCPGHVGVNGIVIMDTKNTVKIISKDDIVRTIPKDSSVFSVTLDSFQLTVFGKYLCVRPAERSVKKIKTRMSAYL